MNNKSPRRELQGLQICDFTISLSSKTGATISKSDRHHNRSGFDRDIALLVDRDTEKDIQTATASSISESRVSIVSRLIPMSHHDRIYHVVTSFLCKKSAVLRT
jgi:hypothetical protein